MAGRSRLTFIIQSESLTGDEISRRLGLRPTHVAERGDPISRRMTGAGRRLTTWELASPLNEDQEPAAHLARLLPIVEQRIPALRQVEGADANVAVWPASPGARAGRNLRWIG
jgi:hypothetical protein